MAEGKQPDSQSALFLPHRKDENKLFQSAKKLYYNYLLLLMNIKNKTQNRFFVEVLKLLYRNSNPFSQNRKNCNNSFIIEMLD